MAKAFVILDAVAAIRGSATISELSTRTGLPRSTVHRIVTTLVERQALLRTDSGVQLGIRLFELGGLVPAQTRLRKEATPYMSELFASTRQTIHLGVLEGTEVLCTAKIMGHLPVGVPSQMGVRTKAHTCALGKAMLAFARPGAPARRPFIWPPFQDVPVSKTLDDLKRPKHEMMSKAVAI